MCVVAPTSSPSHVLSVLSFNDLCLITWTLHEAVAGHKSGTALHASIVCSLRPWQIGLAYIPEPKAKQRSF